VHSQCRCWVKNRSYRTAILTPASPRLADIGGSLFTGVRLATAGPGVSARPRYSVDAAPRGRLLGPSPSHQMNFSTLRGTATPWPSQIRFDQRSPRAPRLSALKAAGAERTFSEKQSGVKADRKQLAKAIDALAKGNVLLVTRLDRLARSTRDLLNVLDAVGKAGAGFRSLADPMIDTTSPGRLILAVLGALAEFERSMILARTAEGRKRAQDRGVSDESPSYQVSK
jgi:hypothetical protein